MGGGFASTTLVDENDPVEGGVKITSVYHAGACTRMEAFDASEGKQQKEGKEQGGESARG